MKMIFSHPTLDNINIKFGQFTQIIGHNQQIKYYMWQLMIWYFSNKKYSEEDLSIFNQQEPQIFIDTAIINKNEYKIITLSSIEDIINQMNYKKGTIAFDFIKDKLNNVEISKQVEEINNKLEQIAILVNTQLKCQTTDVNYQLNSVDFTISQLLLKNFIPSFKFHHHAIAFELINNIDKVLFIIKMLDSILEKSCSKMILIMKNMDDYLTHDEFIKCCQLFDELCDKYLHFNIIIFPSNEGYLYVTEKNIEYINIVSDIITHYYEFDFMYQRFIVHYPNNHIPSENEFLILLQKNSNSLFTQNLKHLSLSAVDLVMINIMNNLYGYNKKLTISYKLPNNLTINFLRENFDISD